MLKLPWTDKKSPNIEVMRMAGEKRCLINEIRGRQLKFFGHVIRRSGLENQVLTGLID